MKLKTVQDVIDSNLFGNNNYYRNILEHSLSAIDDNGMSNQFDITDTPIAPMSMNDDYTPILLSGEVMSEYRNLIELINCPQTAKEYSYVLLGKSALFAGETCYLIEKFIDCNSDNDNLSNRETHIDNNKLNDIITYAINNGYNFISLGHTHPNIPEEEKKNTLANFIPENVKNDEYIRETGLNLSLQDFISYESLYQYFIKNSSITTCQAVIMFNGEITMFRKQENELKRFVIIIDRTTGEPVYVSSKSDKNKKVNT